MKTKPSVHRLISSAVLITAIAAHLHATPPAPGSDPVADQAKRKVSLEIYSKVSPRQPSFSRALSIPSHQLDFQPPILVQGENRLPFTIAPRRDPKAKPELQGYVRLSDQEIFLLDPKTGTHRPSKEDPRFAPPLPPPVKVEPTKPL